MSSQPVILLTGASRGIGLAVAHFLLKCESTPKLLLVSRTASALETLQKEYPSQVAYVAGDLSTAETAKQAVSAAVASFGKIDGVIVNHAVLDPVGRLENASFDEWRTTFEINLFSAVALLKEAIPELRKTKGKVVFVSSGAATSAYEGWGAYGSTKAAMNHLNQTLAMEEPDITSISIRPGVIDTQMQQEIREKHGGAMGASHEKFMELKKSGGLLRPEQPGNVIARLALIGAKKHSGKFYSWNSAELSEYQDTHSISN